MSQKGFDGWIEIFRGGRQKDALGKEHDGDALIEKAVASFDPSFHEPPAVVGHPKGDMPAYGWVEALRVEAVAGGKRLYAKFRQVVPEFAEAVEAGRFKKRSAAFYPDGRLRHVGFLGAMPPAVKGLADIPFTEGEEVIEFYDPAMSTAARLFARLRDYLIERDGTEKADQVLSAWDVDYLKEQANMEPAEALPSLAYSETTKEDDMPEGTTTLTQDDIDAAVARGKAEAAAEFAEQQKAAAGVAGKGKIATYLATPIKDGGPLPAWVDGGLGEFLESLVASEVIEFGEGEAKKQKQPLDWALDFLGTLPAGPEFREVAGRGEDAPATTNPREIARLAVEFKEQEATRGRVITITEAVAHVTGAGK